MPFSPTPLQQWVEESARLTQPDRIVWLRGGPQEYESLLAGMVQDGSLQALNPEYYPRCYLHRSAPNDVARTEEVTFICTPDREDAGPTNNWMAPQEAKEKLHPLYRGCMKGRTMYVIPYLMGPADSPFSQAGCEITDSAYVAASMHLMTKVGDLALRHIEASGTYVGGLHSLGDLDPERRYLMHFPDECLIWSFGSGYGGNALLGKKAHALRIASATAREQGWMAEHMLILGLDRPGRETIYMAGAFPSACGKTNLAMLNFPEFEEKGYRVRTVGDDIAWLRVGRDGRLRAVNPEAGFFGVAPGTNWETNDVAMATIQHDTLFTNVAVTPDGLPWWEGMDDTPPDDLRDWQGNPWSGENSAAHPNSRFTAPITNCPALSPRYDDPEFRVRFARLVTHYWRNAAFLGEDQLLRDAAILNGIPGVLIHGRYDVSSPLETAWRLSQRWATSRLHVLDDAGHGGGNTFLGLTVDALNRFAAR
ncbi:MAG: phosphoenolpyruvate carboxykinase (GTP) [Armatimonadetes bacterium]|nr:phosphoenolpyruvate carboxykinase (GTP) [Armatimonadota bacterium]